MAKDRKATVASFLAEGIEKGAEKAQQVLCLQNRLRALDAQRKSLSRKIGAAGAATREALEAEAERCLRGVQETLASLAEAGGKVPDELKHLGKFA